jgi:hypothetical protein
MARMARVVALGIPPHITRRGNRRHGSGNEYGVPGITGEAAARTCMGKARSGGSVPHVTRVLPRTGWGRPAKEI